MLVEKAGLWSPGSRVKCRRDLIEYAHKVESSITDEPYPMKDKVYLIDECHDMAVKKNLMHVPPNRLAYRIKLYVFTMKNDSAGFPYLFNSRDFTFP